MICRKIINKTLFLLLAVQACSIADIGSIIRPLGCEDADFKLVYNGRCADILYDINDYKVVEISANNLADDIKNVTGSKPSIHTDLAQAGNTVVIVGTIGHSKFIDRLIKENKINSADIAGKWETYAIQTISKPYENISSALVIFGSDRRAVAFGIYELSRQIGVNPWYWWADVPAKKKENLVIKNGSFHEGPPSVKYRGIFINDEDWGLKPWASKTFDPALGDIGPNTYKKVFELLLRLKANHCWPAMHSCTKPFNYYPENKQVADDYAIVMGSAHCEPLLFNNASEWDKKTMGEWRYDTNKENVYKVLDKRVSENGKFENVYTVGLRGMHDSAMIGGLPMEKQIALLEQAIGDQRKILTSHIDKKITDVPQVFIPYKEVLTLYNNGLKVPDDVTLMWVDDNYGYIRRLSNSIETARSGGGGVYYHVSYLGGPTVYLWLCTTSPALIWEEMAKAYSFDARRIWILNVGDIKPGEYQMQFFLDLAWDVNIVNSSNVSSHLSDWLGDIFGSEYQQQLTEIMTEFYLLGFERKPEFMCFGSQYRKGDSADFWQTEYSFTNYMEAERRLERYKKIRDKAEEIRGKIPADLASAYFELVYYPVVAAGCVDEKILLAQKNRWYAQQSRIAANNLPEQVKFAHEKVIQLTDEYDNLLDGKWKYIISATQNFDGLYQNMPPTTTIQPQDKPQMGVFVQNNQPNIGIDSARTLPCFNPFYDRTYFIEIFNKGKQPFEWSASADTNWVKISKSSGEITTQERIYISIDWSKVPQQQENLNAQIQIHGAGNNEIVYVNAFNPILPDADKLKGLFVEDNGVISIYAANYRRKVEAENTRWNIINDIGLTGKLIAPSITIPGQTEHKGSSYLEYDIYTFNTGFVEMRSFALPVFPINGFTGARYAISIDDAPPQAIDIAVSENSGQWRDNVRRNAAINITRHYIASPGKHTVKLWMKDTGMAFDKIIIDLGGLKMSYLGPQETFVK